jgi:tetratricopeptide (TPR) repeat protein
LFSFTLIAATILTYANSLPAAFVFDDRDTILWDKHLGDFSSLSRVLLGVRGGPTAGRPLTSLSFHINSLVAKQSPAGYRAVNVLIHVTSGLVLFALMRRVLLARGGVTERTANVTTTAFAISLLWLLHPIQTESVTYVHQRAESLMGLLFLLTVYFAVRGFQAADSLPWFRGATVACTLSVLSKEVGVVAPVVVLLYDRLLVSQGWRRALKEHWRLYVGLAFSWFVAGLLQLTAPRGYGVGLSDPRLSPWGNLQRQVVGVTKYLTLVFWPSPLVLDYGFPPPAPSIPQSVAAAALLGALVAASVLAARRWPLVALAGISFFLILAPSSSVIAMLTEVLAEHRMYLPLGCVVALVVGGAVTLARLGERRGALVSQGPVRLAGWVSLFAVAGSLGFLTWQRNIVYRSELSLWQDTAAKVPDNPRAQNNLGMALLEVGRTSEALARFRKAVALSPSYFEANGNTSAALERLGQFPEALVYINRAVEINPESGPAHEGVVRLLVRLSRWNEALAAARAYVERLPEAQRSNYLYGSLLSRMGRATEALPYLQRAEELGSRGAGDDTRLP